jgi:hypothetical protein
MGRYQRGHFFEQHRAFHVRYYTTEVIDGQPKRVQRFSRFIESSTRHSTALHCRCIERPRHPRTCPENRESYRYVIEKVGS